LFQRFLLFAAVLLFSRAVSSEDLSFKYIHEEYKKGNYETVSRLSLKSLKSPESQKDPRLLFLYISTEKDWVALKSTVQSVSLPNWKENIFYWNAIYLFLERALVLGENELIIKYGRAFQKEGKSNPKYNDANFILAYALADLKNYPEALKILEDLEKQNLSGKLQNQIVELKTEIKNNNLQ